MSTHAGIGIVGDNGTVSAIYCHNDGYPDGVGKILTKYFTEESSVFKLISLGNLSSLAKNMNPTSLSHSFRQPEDNVTIAYHRDRGDDLEIHNYITKEAFFERGFYNFCASYLYLFENNKWICMDCDNTFIPLTSVEHKEWKERDFSIFN